MSHFVTDLIELSKYAGERFDLVQAGGGNTSVKLPNGEMHIKASGYTLSEVDENHGFSCVNTEQVAAIVCNPNVLQESDKRKRESLAVQLTNHATIDKANRPSIETTLHSLLHTYTLHTHPVVVNMICVRYSWKEELNNIFSEEDIALVPYETPGIDLAIRLKEVIDTFKDIPKIIFLQNHGLIISANSKEEVISLNEKVLLKIEAYLGVSMDKYRTCNAISKLVNSQQAHSNNYISYLSENEVINEQLRKDIPLFETMPFCPDSLVFCGFKCVLLKDTNDTESIYQYLKEYKELPKIILLNNQVFISATSVKKAKEIEDVLKFNLMVQRGNKNISFLPTNELSYLANWEAEKHRQNL